MPQLLVLLKRLVRLAVLHLAQLSSVAALVVYNGTTTSHSRVATLVVAAQQTVQQLLAVATQQVLLVSANIIPKEKHVR